MKQAPVKVTFKSQLYNLKNWTILAVPKDKSLELGSRGQISVASKLNGYEFSTVLEPDGRWSHWIRITNEMLSAAGVVVGDTVEVELIKRKDWPEPIIPNDLQSALYKAPQKVMDKWKDITPMARWEWVRWMNATLNEETRAVRIEKTISKLDGKHRRPCCFNLSACTVPYVSKGGKLMLPDEL